MWFSRYEKLQQHDKEAQPQRMSEASKRLEHGTRLRRVSRAALVVLTGMCLAFFALFLSELGVPAKRVPGLSLAEWRNGTYASRAQPVTWVPEGTNGQILLRKAEGYEVVNWGHKTGGKIVSGLNVHAPNENPKPIRRLKLNKQQSHAIAFTDQVKHWRHSTYSHIWLLDIESQTFQSIEAGVSVAEWSPDSRSIAYVVDHNVFVYDLATNSSTQVTFDGGADVFNGIPDWVYEEEVFSGDSALWWSNQGSHLAYLRTNDSLVPKFPIPYFMENTENNLPAAYPELVELKYPKPGFANPKVELWLYNVHSKEAKPLQINTELNEPIISEVIWVGESVVVKVMDRESDFLEVWVSDTTSTLTATRTRSYSSEELGGSWFEVTHNSHAVGTEGYVDTIDVNGYNHLGYFSPANASEPVVLTSGPWEVDDSAIAVNLDTRHVYFTGTKRSSRQSTLYRVSLDQPDRETQQVAFEGDGVYQVEFSGDTSFATVNYYAPEAPLVQKIVRLDNGSAAGASGNSTATEWRIEENKGLLSLLKHRHLVSDEQHCSAVSYGSVDIGDVTVNYREIRPSKFNPRHKYPLLFFNYGGPGSQMVQEKLVLDFQRIYAETHNAVVVTVDPRGTGKRGRKFRASVRDHLGQYEADDVISVAKIWNKKAYIDSSTTTIWGWSYGGYLTLKTLERDTDLAFKYGIAVAPVTDWSLYDSIYTERYMHMPSDNAEGYKHTGIHNVTNLARHNRFLVMHGTGDDNVHFQNTLTLLDKLDLAGVENYDVHVFPDSDHSISFHNANHIVYDKIDRWLSEHQRATR